MADFATLAVEFVSRGGDRLMAQLRSVGEGAERTERQVSSLSKAMTSLQRLLALGAMGAGLKVYLDMADKMQSLNTQIKLVTSSHQEFVQVQKELFSMSQNTASSLEATTQLYTRSARALQDYGYSQREVLKFTDTVNKAMAIGGANAQEQASAILQLSQALGSGALKGNDLSALKSSAPTLIKAIADGMGLSMAKFSDLASKGEITSQKIVEAFKKVEGQINEQFKQMPLTFSGAMQQMQNAVLNFISNFDQANGISGLFAQGIIFLAQNFEILAKALIYATTTYIAYNAVTLATNFSKANEGVGLLATSFRFLTTAIRNTTVAMLANPLGLLVVAIGTAAYAFDAFLSDMEFAASKTGATWGDVAKGVWDDFTSMMKKTADYVVEEWDKATNDIGFKWSDLTDVFVSVGNFILDSVKSLLNGIIGLFVGGYNAVVIIWDNFPAALEKAGVVALNALIDIVESGINKVINLIKAPFDLIDYVAKKFGGKLIDTSGWSAKLKDLKVQGSKQSQEVGQAISQAFASGFSKDYVGNAIDSVVDYLTEAGDRAKATRDAQNKPVSLDTKGKAKPMSSSDDKKGKKKKPKKEKKKKEAKPKDYLKEWQEYYNELERANADALARIALEEERTMREMLEKAKAAKVSFAEIEKAKTLIAERYAKERMQIAEKYAPELRFKRELKEMLNDIERLEEMGLLNKSQADLAEQKARWGIGEQRAKQAGEDVISPYDKFNEQFDPAQKVINEQKVKQAELQSYYDQSLISLEDFLKKKQQLEEQYKNKALLEELSAYSAGLESLGTSFGTMADLAAQSVGKQSGVYKALFATSKAFAIADSMLKLQQAVMQAMTDPSAITPAQKFANMAAVMSAGMNVVSQISSVGMAHSGIDNIPKEGTWLLDKGERVVDSRTNGDLKTFLQNQNKGQSNNNGKASVNVQIINNGNPVEAKVTSEERNGETQITVELIRQMRGIAKQEANQVIMDNFGRAGGAFAR